MGSLLILKNFHDVLKLRYALALQRLLWSEFITPGPPVYGIRYSHAIETLCACVKRKFAHGLLRKVTTNIISNQVLIAKITACSF